MTNWTPTAFSARPVAGRPGAAGVAEVRRTPRVLLIDDDPLVLDAISRGLRRRFEVVALDGAMAALMVLDHDQGFDAILCDLMMPELDGGQFVGLLSKRYPHLLSRVTMVTSGGATPRTSEFLRTTDLPIVPKPARMAELITAVERTASRRDGQ